MLDTRPALHTVLGLFAVFLSDNIKRVATSGISLPGVALVDDMGRLNATRKTYTIIALRARLWSVRFTFVVIFGRETYSPGRYLI